MAIERRTIGNRVFFVDRDNQLIFTKGELDMARKRFFRESERARKKQIMGR